ncbi:hypothetical protein WMY93_032512 [Mugilogobius chulae]|uniref:EGF-like domain-containing protein n=1 Tax=Mugilogobius chulae TaxID=88201 RepID=A0AAW0MND5_9GOBI
MRSRTCFYLFFTVSSDAFEGLQSEECGVLNGCENGRCVRVQEGFTCDCFDGFSLDLSRMACVDVDECSELNRRMSLCKTQTAPNYCVQEGAPQGPGGPETTRDQSVNPELRRPDVEPRRHDVEPRRHDVELRRHDQQQQQRRRGRHRHRAAAAAH